ncbi:MAG: cytochrome b N-terminal domain-containing protein [Deltaproteobacteria bacterium]|nr:cytochrome b N-terminal domain-containing protein [Deltaproteobacteria bacterium]
MLDDLKPEKVNWRHYFGGLSFIMLMLQLISGIFLIFFYEPSLSDAYKTIQKISNKVYGGGLLRNLHRWIPALLFIVVTVHTTRCFIRKDFSNQQKRVLWMTGVLLLLPIFLLVATGLILPWEWKGYWFMEMVTNYFATVPVIGSVLKTFFMDTYTIPRYYALHILVFPLITFILVDYHLLAKLRKRGIFKYLLRHIIIVIPFLLILFYLAITIQIPSNDPIDVPLPLEGAGIIAPEWYFLIMLLPFMYIKSSFWLFIIAIFAPLVVLFAIAFMPYYLKGKEEDNEEESNKEKHPHHRATGIRLLWHKIMRDSYWKKIAAGVVVTVITFIVIGLLYLGSWNSPTLGCNSCHNISKGQRIGIPPDFFKDRSKLPLLDDNEWMLRHWYYPNEVW